MQDAIDKLRIIHARLDFRHGSQQDEYPEQVLAAMFIGPGAKVLELGANIGRNSCVIASLLDNSANLVSVECDTLWAAMLRDNRDRNGLSFAIETAALSRRPLVQKGMDTKPGPPELGWTPVDVITWPDLRAKHGVDFDTLVVDCEGALYGILCDEPGFLSCFHTVVVENDYTDPAHKQFCDAEFRRAGLECVCSANRYDGMRDFYQVWKRAANTV